MSIKKKISKSKRNNQNRNKLIKKGVIKKTGNKNKFLKEAPPKLIKHGNNATNEESEESDHGEDMLQMVDEDDIEFLKKAITNRSYSFLNKVKYSGPSKAKRRKSEREDDTLENEYEDKIEDTSNQKVKMLLPIKTKTGLVTREVIEKIEDTNEQQEIEQNEIEEENVESDAESVEEFSFEDNNIDMSKPISATQLLAARSEVLKQKKVHIGTLSSGLLENPEEKVTNLRTLLKLMDNESPEIYFSIRKLVIISLLEVFKDILPSYEIKNIKTDAKLKKDTLKLHKYEENLLQYYKKFLQKLEKYSLLLIRKKGDSRKHSEEEIKLAELSVQVMCELLVTHPYFNFAHNIAHAVVPFLNNPNRNVRETVKNAIKTVFIEDRKEEITLRILQITNAYLKTHSHNMNSCMLEILLVLDLRGVNLDQEKEQDIKQKKINAKKQRVLQLSKRERKRKKKLQELEKEMLETKAEENKQTKQKNLTEITKLVFNIYFRILKHSSNTKVLGVCLEGLAKFAHCINLEYYIDIVNVLDSLLKENWLGYREKLHCIQTIFIMLSGQGEALNLDPTRFYNILYKDLITSIGLKDVLPIALPTLINALVKRRKKITTKRTLGFVKRLATLSLQLVHNESLGCLGLIKSIMQSNRSVDILLDLDSSSGDGKFQADLDDPEYANAGSTALFEMITLSRHYHPIVAKYAKHIASGVPVTGNGCLPQECMKLNAEQLFIDYSMSEMAFNPAVPIPKKGGQKPRKRSVLFAAASFEDECRDLLKAKRRGPFWISLN